MESLEEITLSNFNLEKKDDQEEVWQESSTKNIVTKKVIHCSLYLLG